jgi:hypothetical protein
MPITTERLNDLLIEHEQCLILMREVKDAIIDTMRASEYDPDEPKTTTFFAIKSLLASFDRAPDQFAKMERRHYKSTIKRTLNTRERMRMLRRRRGIPERQEPSNDPAGVMADLLADKEYRRLNAVPYGADGKPMIDPDAAARERAAERKKSYVYDPDKPMDNASFLAMIGEAPAPKTPEEIAAEGLALLDSLPSDEPTTSAPAAPEGKSFLSPIEREICKDVLDK